MTDTTPITELRIYAYGERPDFIRQRGEVSDAWAEFMYHDAVANQYWDDLYEYFPEYQFWITDDQDHLVAEGNTIPFTWDAEHELLPDQGWDHAIATGVTNRHHGIAPNTLSALAATISPRHQGRGISTLILKTMKSIALRHGLRDFVAPVRPSLKHLYPLTSMERYITWTHTDGQAPFDPWLRTHWRQGAKIVRVASESMIISGTIADWEEWTQMRFPESGTYFVPRALNPITIDCDQNRGVYVEPNVWMRHDLSRSV